MSSHDLEHLFGLVLTVGGLIIATAFLGAWLLGAWSGEDK